MEDKPSIVEHLSLYGKDQEREVSGMLEVIDKKGKNTEKGWKTV